jgi:hypothetical protein
MSTIRVRNLDSSHDVVFGGGKANYSVDLDAIAQMIRTKLLLFKGEWWEDETEGLPMWQSILGVPGAGANREAVDSLIQKRILETPYVTNMERMESSYDEATRAYSISVTVNTTFGQLTITNG